MSEGSENRPSRSSLAVLFLVVVIDLVGFGIVLPLLPRYAKDYRATPLELGILMASFSAMQFLFAPFWGRLSDRRGRRPILMVGLFGSIVAYTLFGFAHSYAVLLVSRIAAGFFGATIGAASAYIADVTTHRERGRGMALIGAAFGIGFTIGPAIGGFAAGIHRSLAEDPRKYAAAMDGLDAALGWLGLHFASAGAEDAAARAANLEWMKGLPGFVAAALSFVALLLAWRKLEEPARHTEKAARRIFDATAIRHALATPTVPLVLGLQFLATFAFANFEGTLSLLTQEQFRYDEGENGRVFAFLGLCLVVSQGAVVRRLMPRVGEVNFVVAGTLLMALGLAGLGFAQTVGILLPALAVAVLGFAMVTPSLASLLSRRTPAATQGEILGLNQSILSMARILGPLVGNVLFGAGATLPEFAAANLLLVAFLGALALRRAPAPPPAPDEVPPPPVPS